MVFTAFVSVNSEKSSGEKVHKGVTKRGGNCPVEKETVPPGVIVLRKGKLLQNGTAIILQSGRTGKKIKIRRIRRLSAS